MTVFAGSIFFFLSIFIYGSALYYVFKFADDFIENKGTGCIDNKGINSEKGGCSHS
jgi:hypothetical protein